MTDSLDELRRTLGVRRGAVPAAEPASEEDEASCPAFGYLRGLRERALHVSFRLADGSVVTMPYNWLGPCRYHPSTGIVLVFAGGDLFLVVLRGRNLDAVREHGVSLHERGLLRHRVVWVQEASPAEARALPEGACVVEKIDIRVVTPGEAAAALGLRASVGLGKPSGGE